MESPAETARPAAQVLREAGLVFTVQRGLIWSALAGRPDHPTADEVWGTVGGAGSGISRTTVYRTLEAFVQAGLAQRVGHLGAAVRYDPRTGRHHHLICEACGTVHDLEDEDLRPCTAIGLKERSLRGFEVRELSVLVRGRCPDCR